MWGNTLPAILGRWSLFAGLLLLVGAWGFRTLVLRWRPGGGGGAAGTGELDAVASALRRAAWAGSGLVLAGVLLRLGIQVLDFLEPREPVGPQLRFLVLESFWGRVWMGQLALAVAAPLVVPAGLARPSGRALAAGFLVLALAVSPAFYGHAAGAERFTRLAMAADAAHVLAAGLWLGTLSVLVLAALGTPPGRSRDEALRRWMDRFHPLAMACVGVVVATGLFASWLHGGSPRVLFRTDWGFTLLVKLLGVGVVLGVGWRNGWRLRPRLGEPGASGRLLDSALLEVLVAQLVLLATATLVAMSPLEEHHLFDNG